MRHDSHGICTFLACSVALLFGPLNGAQAQQLVAQRAPELIHESPLVEVRAPTLPLTKLEALSEKTGVVIVRHSSMIGELNGKRGSVTIETKELIETGNNEEKATGLSFVVRDQAKSFSHVSLVDYDEIDGLIDALDYIAKVDQKASNGEDFEAVYRTRGGLTIWASNRGKSEIVAAVVSKGVEKDAVAAVNFTDLPQLKKFIIDAKAAIDAGGQNGDAH
jgi:hypothetical protein